MEIDTVDGSTAATTAATSIPPADGVIPVATAGVDGLAPVESSPARPATYPPAAPAVTAASVNAAAAANRLRRGAGGAPPVASARAAPMGASRASTRAGGWDAGRGTQVE